jgi:hypothetical protein
MIRPSRMKILIICLLIFSNIAEANDWREKLKSCFQYLTTRKPEGSWVFSGARLEDFVYSYNAYFSEALGGKTFEKFAQDRIKSGKTAHLADIFGSAVFSPQPESFTTLTGLRNSPLYDFQLPTIYKTFESRSEVAGDAFQELSWQRLDENRKAREIPEFDIIVFRPLSSLIEHAPNAMIESYLRALNQAWTRLSSQDGLLIAQIPASAKNNMKFYAWRTRTAGKGLDLKVYFRDGFYRNYISITKTENSASDIL